MYYQQEQQQQQHLYRTNNSDPPPWHEQDNGPVSRVSPSFLYMFYLHVSLLSKQSKTTKRLCIPLSCGPTQQSVLFSQHPMSLLCV
mmetsp:Transcript_13344/g.29382  ORF Transcript_13344/g.29382 Transcript_13344/m.29382 type:complete len:86 (+) Transcript_13344:2040-2297(+)